MNTLHFQAYVCSIYVSKIHTEFVREHQLVPCALQTIGRVGATTDLISQHIEQADGQQAKRDLLSSLVSKIPVRTRTHACAGVQLQSTLQPEQGPGGCVVPSVLALRSLQLRHVCTCMHRDLKDTQ